MGRSDEPTAAAERGPHEPTAHDHGKGGTLPLANPGNLPPESLDGRDVRLMEVIGRGGMGQVFRGEQMRLGRAVAFKQLIGDDAKQRERFVREARITAQLDHPNIVPVHSLEVSKRGSVIGYAMKLVEGKTLAALIADAAEKLDREHSLPTRLDHFLKICDAIAFAHARGILHRDLKPANIMIGKFGEVYVMDWGIARSLGAPEESLSGTTTVSHPDLTRAGEVMGSVPYMSPEQAKGGALDARSDQYSLGLILFEIVSLKRALGMGDVQEIFARALDGRKMPLEAFSKRERVTPELRAIVAKATAFDPQNRYASVGAMSDDLRRHFRGEAVNARPDTAIAKLLRSMSRHRRTTLATLVGVVMLSAIAIGWISYRKKVAELETRRRGEQLTGLYIQVAAQGHRIDAQFQLMEEGLEGLRTAAEWALTGPEPLGEARVYRSTDFANPATRPSDFTDQSRYRWPVSMDAPVAGIAPGVDTAAIAPKLRRLSLLRDPMADMIISAGGMTPAEMTPAARHQYLLDRKSPIDYAYVGLREGVHFQLPGVASLPPDYDVRTSGFYTMSANKRGRRWGAPYVDSTTDERGDDLVLPCTQGLWSPTGEFLGIAGVETTVTKLVNTELVMKDRKTLRASLVNAEGRKVVDSGDAEKLFKTDGRDVGLLLTDFDISEIANAVRAGKQGIREVTRAGVHEIVVISRLDVIGWFYVVEIDASTL